MPLFIQKIPHLLFGVSQRPDVQKDSSHLQTSDNWLARATYGLAKRPPFEFLGKLTSSLTGIAGAKIFSIQRDNENRYRVIIQNGALAVYDLLNNGAEITVVDNTSDTYLNDAGGKGFRHVTVGDATFITNRGVTVTQTTGKSPRQPTYAIVTVEQADFSTNYAITLNNTTYAITTVDQGDATARGQINTDQIAQELFRQLDVGLQNIFTKLVFNMRILGSSIYIESRRGNDFSINVTDGLSDNGLRLIKGQIADAEDLVFTRAPNGTKVNVTGDPSTDKDDFWLEYDSTISDPDGGDDAIGIWIETVAPGVALNMDSKTLPHRLSFKASEIEGFRRIEFLPPIPTIGDFFARQSDGGWTEDQDGGGIGEENDDIITINKRGRRRLIPGADGITRQIAELIYDIDASRVEYGKDVIVNLIHRTAGGVETTLDRTRYQPGETLVEQTFRVVSNDAGEGTWLATDRFKIELEYGDGVAPSVNEEATLTVVGAAVGTKADLIPRYVPIRVFDFGGISVTIKGTTYREGTQVGLNLNFNSIPDNFLYVVPAGGQTAAQVATGLALLIDTTGTTDYTSIVVAGGLGTLLRINVTGDVSADVEFQETSVTFVANKAVLPITLVTNEFVGETIVNGTDGSSGSITANTNDGVFSAVLAGGTDNLFQVGDRIKIVGTGGYFVLEAVTYDPRRVGDEETNPWPSFKDDTVKDVFFFRNRLGFISGRKVILSESGDVLNFFRNSIQSLLDGDVIDVESAHGDVAIFHSAVPWNNTLFLWTDNAQYELSGVPVLSPKSVRLDIVSRYSNTSLTPPAVIGPRLYFAHGQTGSGKIMEWKPPVDDATQFQARDLTVDVPTYLPGQVIDLAGDFAHGILAVIMDGDQGALYIWSFTARGDGTNVHETWQRFVLPAGATARQVDFTDGKLGLLYSYSDGVLVDELDVDQTIAGASQGFLDRRVSSDDPAVLTDFSSGVFTAITFPFAVLIDETEGVVQVWNKDTGTLAVRDPVQPRPGTQNIRVTGDFTAVNFDVGIEYTARARLSPIFFRGQDGSAETGGRTQIREMQVEFNNTESLKIEVTPQGRAKFTHVVSFNSPTEGRKRVPVLSRGETTVVELVSDAPGDARVNSIDIEMMHTNRSRRA